MCIFREKFSSRARLYRAIWRGCYQPRIRYAGRALTEKRASNDEKFAKLGDLRTRIQSITGRTYRPLIYLKFFVARRLLISREEKQPIRSCIKSWYVRGIPNKNGLSVSRYVCARGKEGFPPPEWGGTCGGGRDEKPRASPEEERARPARGAIRGIPAAI